MTVEPASPSPRPQPRVVVRDPVRRPDWSYELEEARLAAHDVLFVVPENEAAADAALPSADIVAVSGTMSRALEASEIARLRRCVGIVSYSTGTDGIDTVAATAAGIPVRGVPGYCTDEVSDHALTLLLAAERRLLPIGTRTAAGEWDAVRRSPEQRSIRRLRGQTLGVIGAGRIGRQVARKARAFGFRTIAYDPLASDRGDSELEFLPFQDVLRAADALVLCAALTETSRGMIGRDALAVVRSGVILVNVARGALIDENALAAALRSGRVAVAALDVRSSEPPEPTTNPLAGLSNVILTPHYSAASAEARQALHQGAADQMLDLLVAAGRATKRP